MATTFLFANNASTTLAVGVNDAATTLTVASGTGALFPSPGAGEQFAVTLVDAATGLVTEICYCTSRTSDTLTVVRAREGTSAATWAAGSIVANFMTAGTAASFAQFDSLQGVTDYWPDTGSADALVITPDPAFDAYFEGMGFKVKVAANNTGAATLNVNGLGTKAIVDEGGAALIADMLVADAIMPMVYTAAGEFQLVTTPPISSFISALPAETNPQTADEVPIYSDGSGVNKKTTLSTLSDFFAIQATGFAIAPIIPGQPYHSPEHLLPDDGNFGGVYNADDTIYLMPFSKKIIVDAVCARALISAGGQVYFGIYSADANGYPDTLIDQSAAVTVTAGNLVGLLSLGGYDIASLVWLAVKQELAGSLTGFSRGLPTALASALLGQGNPLLTTPVLGLYATSIGGTGLPSTLPALSVVKTQIPLLSVRAA